MNEMWEEVVDRTMESDFAGGIAAAADSAADVDTDSDVVDTAAAVDIDRGRS